MISPEKLKTIRETNRGCHQCDEGRPHRHSPDFKPYILNQTIELLLDEVERLQADLAEKLDIDELVAKHVLMLTTSRTLIKSVEMSNYTMTESETYYNHTCPMCGQVWTSND